MAADVSSMVNSNNPEMLTTRDLLGELSKVSGSKDLQGIPPLVESKLSPPLLNMNNDKKHYAHHIGVKESHPALKFLEESCLELKLVPSAPGHSHSVCTLDKVKSALLRAEKESCRKKRSSQSSSSSHPSPSSNDKQEQEELDRSIEDDQQQKKVKGSMFAVGCPACLMYVMTLKTNPICPRCNSTIPSPLFSNKPRFDLNASL